MTASRCGGHPLEAIWYAYAIIEDRLISVLHNSGGAYENPKKLYRNLGRKLDIVDKRRKRDALLKAYFSNDLITSIKRWKDQRNGLIHAMACAALPMTDLDSQSVTLAVDGDKLAFDMCRQARLLKRNRKKVAIPAKPFPEK
jgi:hypothetical protein